ncbi:MAG: ATP-binding cassette domain-containing protein [Bauldia sp.]
MVGPNGAGKTTLLRAAAGLIPSSGEIIVGGSPLNRLSLQQRARTIGYLPQGMFSTGRSACSMSWRSAACRAARAPTCRRPIALRSRRPCRRPASANTPRGP